MLQKSLFKSFSYHFGDFLGMRVGGMFLRFYEQIISGIWAILLLTPIDNYINYYFNPDTTTFTLSRAFIVIFIAYNLFFILASIVLPYIRRYQLEINITKFLLSQNLKRRENIALRRIVSNNIMCKSFFTKEGFWHFFVINIFNIAIISLYFAIDAIIDLLNGKSGNHVVSFLFFFVLFLILSFFGRIIDSKYSNSSVKRNKPSSNRDLSPVSNNAKLIVFSIIKLISRDTMENNIDSAILEDAFDNICRVIKMSEK